MERNPRRAVLVVIGGVSALRMAYALILWNRIGGPDGVTYHDMADDFADRGLFTREIANQPVYPPLYSLVLAGFYRVFGHHPVAIKPFQVAMLALMTWMAFRVADRVFGERVALVTVLALSVSPVWLSLGHPLMYEPLMATLILAGVWLMIEGHPGWAGAAMGLSALAQNRTLFFLPVFAWLAWRRYGIRAGTLALVAALVPVALWIGRMEVVYGEAIPIRTYNGYNLLITHNDAVKVGSNNSVVIKPPECAHLPTVPDRNFNEVDRKYTRCAIDWALSHPAKEVFVLAPQRLFNLFSPFLGPWQHWSTWHHHFDPRVVLPDGVRAAAAFRAADVGVTGAYLAVWLAVAVAGGVAAARRGWPGAVLLSPVLYFVVTQVALSSDGRFRLPILPEITVLQAAGVVSAVRLIQRRRERNNGA